MARTFLLLLNGFVAAALACTVYDDSLLTSSKQAGVGGAAGTGGLADASVLPDGSAQTGGRSGSGGAAGAAGAAGAGGGPALAIDMIDDMEDGDGLILVSSGRHGNWTITGVSAGSGQYIFPTNTSFTMTLLDTPHTTYSAATPSTKALRTYGWGVAGHVSVGFSFVGSNDSAPYDTTQVGPYSGIVFWAKVGAQAIDASDIVSTWLVRIHDRNTVPAGNFCFVPPATYNGCYNYWYWYIDFPDPVSEWHQFVVPWSAFTQDPGWGTRPESGAIDPSALYGLDFTSNDPINGTSFDLWVDDLAFYK